MESIKEKIKVVFWDLDDTLWKGTLAENEKVEIIEKRINIIKELNSRGIVNSICSKNDFNKAKAKLVKNNIWDLFVFPSISFLPKGEMIKDTLKNMNLRDNNALFVDDNAFNLREVEYYNPNINTIIADSCEAILDNIFLKGKQDLKLTRVAQYKQLEKKVQVRKNSSSNETFLKESNIRVELIPYSEEYFERIYELSERTNQLNFTKNRMSKYELQMLLNDSSYETKIIHVVDNFGDYGIVGFYTIKGNDVKHFVFSCRIMNMGIEQWVYWKIGFPKFEIVGEVAVGLSSSSQPSWIKQVTNIQDDLDNTLDEIIDDTTMINIFAIGACDLYHPIAYFDMPNQKFVYECNVFHGEERGVNVGTEYIRSQYELNDFEKQYCRAHFMNYIGDLAFNSAIFSDVYDYIIMSFHDDMVYKIYENKNNRNIHVVRSPHPRFGMTSVIDNGIPLDIKQTAKWVADNLDEGYYISEERFYDNLLWISNRVNEKTKIILITGPEMDFFRDNFPKCPEVRAQIIKLNGVLYRLEKEFPNKFAVVDINKCVRTREDITGYIFHLKAQTAYNLFVEIAWTIIRKDKFSKEPMLYKVRRERHVVIFGNNIEARNAFYNLKICGENPQKYVHFEWKNKKIGTMQVEDCAILKGKKDKYYVAIADEGNYNAIKTFLEKNGYTKTEDFIRIKRGGYKKVWNECKDKQK